MSQIEAPPFNRPLLSLAQTKVEEPGFLSEVKGIQDTLLAELKENPVDEWSGVAPQSLA